MIEQITTAIQQNLGLKTSKIADNLKQKKILEWDGFTGSSANFLLADLLKKESTLLYIAKDFEKAASVASDFEEMGVSNVYLFPPTRNKPYDHEKVVDMSIMVQRSEVLEMLKEKPSLTIIASVDAITEKL
ncbi:MAG: hypothetical protein GVY07_00390, partial [Bacteroidetes bacterium]|nr:hypothetical protein [Bacteroidota bacterium]